MEDLNASVQSIWTLVGPASPVRERILELARQAHRNGQGDQDGETPPLVDRTIKSWDSPEAAAWILAIGQATWPGRDAIPTAFPVDGDAEPADQADSKPADQADSKPADQADSKPADPAISEIVLRTYVDALSPKQQWEIGQYVAMWERQCQHAPVESQGMDRFADDGLYEGEMAIVWGGRRFDALTPSMVRVFRVLIKEWEKGASGLPTDSIRELADVSLTGGFKSQLFKLNREPKPEQHLAECLVIRTHGRLYSMIDPNDVPDENRGS